MWQCQCGFFTSEFPCDNDWVIRCHAVKISGAAPVRGEFPEMLYSPCQIMPMPANLPDQSLFIYDDSRLVRLWRNWLAAAGTIPLDKWLRHNLRELASASAATVQTRSTAKNNGSGQIFLADQAALTQAMNNAVRFQQLACAVEFIYQEFCRTNHYADINWPDWDNQWQVRDLQALAPVAFWYWIQLRVGGDRPKRNRAQLPDAPARRDFFQRLLADNYFAGPDTGYLWFGLRPHWKKLIEERKNSSHWSAVQTQLFVQQQTTTPPLWLRIQADKPPADICAQLSAQGVNATLDLEHGICVQGGTGINSSNEYKTGLIEIQDLASQLIARAIAVKPGQKVWDTCAGAGGKTLAIAAQMNNKGAVVATDLHDYKLEELRRRVKRAGFFNVRSFSWNGEAPLRLPKEIAQQQGFDWVLVDAPCSSSGTWRRNPDARWRFDEADTAELIQLQRTILRNAAAGVRKGGNLVYATCSWQVSENEAQVNWFLQQHPQFALQFQRIVGAPELDADTMFVAVLKSL